MGGLVIAPKARILHGHEWVYGTEVRAVFGNPQPGDVVALKDQRDRFLGSAIYNPRSQIVASCWMLTFFGGAYARRLSCVSVACRGRN